MNQVEFREVQVQFMEDVSVSLKVIAEYIKELKKENESESREVKKDSVVEPKKVIESRGSANKTKVETVKDVEKVEAASKPASRRTSKK